MTSSCCIGLCVLNNEKGLPAVLNNITVLREANIFKNVQIVAFYDQSKDQSLQLLKQYQRQYPSTMIYENPEPLNAPRPERIAYARNGILKMIRENFFYYDFFAMMDSNDYSCVGRIRPQVLKEMLKRIDEWDSISFDREDGYYDFWALSYSPFVYSFNHFENWDDAVKKMRSDFTARLEHHKRETPNQLIRVYSAFNGFSLYKSSLFLDSRYSSDIHMLAFPQGTVQTHCETIGQNITGNYKYDCEHRFFHLDAIRRKDARICISVLSLFERVVKNPVFLMPSRRRI